MAFIAWRLRDLPLRWCAVPLTLAMGEAVFLRTWNWSLNVPFLPAPVQWQDVVFSSLVISWLIIRERRPSRPVVRFRGDLLSVCLVIAVVLIEIPLAWIVDGRLGLGVLFAARQWLYVGLAILIWVDLLRRFSRREVLRLLETLAWLSVPLAGMYCLSEIGVRVYPYLGWAPLHSGSTIIVRDFLTFPFWVKLGLVWFVTRPRRTLGVLLAIAVLLSACLLTYTVTIIVGALAALLLPLVLPVLFAHEGRRPVGRLVPMVLLLILVVGVMSVLARGNLDFVVQRARALEAGGLQRGNAGGRVHMLGRTARSVNAYDPAFGLGFSKTGGQGMDALTSTGVLLPDMEWAYVLAWLGWAGVAALAFLFFEFVLSSLRIVRAGGVDSACIGLMLSGIAAWDLCRSLAASDTVWGYPVVAGVFMAIAILERRRAWHREPSPAAPQPALDGRAWGHVRGGAWQGGVDSWANG